MKIAIPSYKRANVLVEHTIKLLLQHDISPKDVTVFVHSAEERKDYRKELKSVFNCRVVNTKLKPSIRDMRNYIVNHYKEGTNLVWLDDDIEKLLVKLNDKQLIPLRGFEDFCEQAFTLCRTNKTKLWGIYPVMNPMFMKLNMTTDLKYIAAGCMGLSIEHDPNLLATVNNKEDFERSMKYYLKYGAILRFSYVTMKTDYYTKTGGISESLNFDRKTDNDIAVKILAKRYPKLCTINNKGHREYLELKLRDRR